MSTPVHEVICDSIAEGVFTVDRDWNVTFFNRAAEEITGISRHQAIGQKCFDVLHADICHEEMCALRRSMHTGRNHVGVHVSILNGAGERLPVSISTAVLRDDAGKIIGGVETFRDLSDIELLRKEIDGSYTFHDIISKNHEIHRIIGIMPDIATSDSTVLIEGPTGSGKELFAKALHTLSTRSAKPFIAVNCGALPDALLESELFGYMRGAFTGAVEDKPGRFALAQGGTVLLDEIADISPAMQVKLLRVLQERRFEPLGGTATVDADVRIIAATNRDLSQLLATGQFRDDLYYRLNVVRIALPALAARREDIPLLVAHLIRRFRATKGKPITGIDEHAMAVLMRYPFPGNVRELQNFIEHAFVLCREGEIGPEHLPRHVLELDAGEASSSPTGTHRDEVARATVANIRRTLRDHGGNRRKAAAALGVHPTTLWRKMKHHGIDWP